jgi:hypothetical protein
VVIAHLDLGLVAWEVHSLDSRPSASLSGARTVSDLVHSVAVLGRDDQKPRDTLSSTHMPSCTWT